MNAERLKSKEQDFNIKLSHAGMKENVIDTNAKGLKKEEEKSEILTKNQLSHAGMKENVIDTNAKGFKEEKRKILTNNQLSYVKMKRKCNIHDATSHNGALVRYWMMAQKVLGSHLGTGSNIENVFKGKMDRNTVILPFCFYLINK